MNVTATGIAVALAVIIAFGLLVFGPGMFNPLAQDSLDTIPTMNQEEMGAPYEGELPSELVVTDTAEGDGEEVASGDTVSVRYTGMLPDGTIFDASVRHGNEPFTFTVGAGQVIKGWDQGLIGMKVGGTRRLVIPPAEGYGSQDLGVIPPNSTLIFDIELLEVQK